MASTPIDFNGGAPIGGANDASASQDTQDAFGLGFEDLLQIVLTQLTYQDPLEPMDNFEFVSQLAQFSQIQQTQEMAESLQTLVAAQSSSQAASLLGRVVDVPAGASTLTGRVIAIGFGEEGASLTIETDEGQTISNINLSAVTQIREDQ